MSGTVESSLSATINAFGQSISAFRKFDKQLAKAANTSKLFAKTRQQLVTFQNAVTRVQTTIEDTANSFNRLVGKIDDTTKKLKENVSSEQLGKALLDSIKDMTVSKAININLITEMSQGAGSEKVAAPNAASMQPKTPSILSVNNGKVLLDQLKKGVEALFKDPLITIVESSARNALEEQQIKGLITNAVGSASIGKDLFEHVQSESQRLGVNISEAAKGVLTFATITNNPDRLKELSSISTTMAALDPYGKGADASATAVKTAINGDSSLLEKNYSG
ncbi:hypothetical protein [Paenibacillus sp. 2TAB19]|uniref:hypothetical protein n=1 Tax=Paenibacillus sp. 2TAB19 TaxID=3233003 RepID=UPI003F95138E